MGNTRAQGRHDHRTPDGKAPRPSDSVELDAAVLPYASPTHHSPLILLPKPIANERTDGGNRFLGARSLRFDLDERSFRATQEQNSHDALAVGDLIALAQGDVTGKL